MSEQSFQAIATRELKLSGPAERVVCLRIGVPGPDPSGRDFRCPFQVKGLSDDSVQYACGVDSFQALNLAFAAIRRVVKTNADVLAAFHSDFALTWEGQSWETVVPIWVPAHDADQVRRLERFLDHELRREQDGEGE